MPSIPKPEREPEEGDFAYGYRLACWFSELPVLASTLAWLDAEDAHRDKPLDRIERKLDTLIKALAEEDEEPEDLTLDGHPAGRERDQTQGLG